MLHAREDYNQTIQQCDREAVRKLFGDMAAYIRVVCAEALDPALVETECDRFRVRLEGAMRGTIPELEPVFLVRAQDQVGASAVRAWAHLHQINGGNDPMYLLGMRHADRMDAWKIKKLADLPVPVAGVGC